jgi:hypothetical protein
MWDNVHEEKADSPDTIVTHRSARSDVDGARGRHGCFGEHISVTERGREDWRMENMCTEVKKN